MSSAAVNNGLCSAHHYDNEYQFHLSQEEGDGIALVDHRRRVKLLETVAAAGENRAATRSTSAGHASMEADG
jgi:hypothetical protein